MRCPFLREAQVKFCCASEFKKLILRGPSPANTSGSAEIQERCSSPEYVSCPSAKQRFEDLPSQDHCPFLQESLSQYCAASSYVKYVPYSDPNLTKCGTSSHRYCELLMTMQNPRLLTPHDVIAPEIDREDESSDGYWLVDGIQTVGWLHYSRNHMWADYDEDGTCHIGIDAFLARALGRVERLAFAAIGAEHNPTVSITVNGIDLPMIFPVRVTVTSVNSRVRADPGRLVTDPYTLGWLFEGKVKTYSEKGGHQVIAASHVGRNLVSGTRAKSWMEEETRRLTEFVSGIPSMDEKPAAKGEKSPALMADGGMFTENILNHLKKEDILKLYNEFFSPRPAATAAFRKHRRTRKIPRESREMLS